MVTWMIVLTVVGVSLTAYGWFARTRNVYRISRIKRRKVLWGDHLLTFEPDTGWVLIPRREATEEDLKEHDYHTSQGDWKDIEWNMMHPNSDRDGADDAQYQVERADYHRNALTNPLHGFENDQMDMEKAAAAHAGLRRELRRNNRQDREIGAR